MPQWMHGRAPFVAVLLAASVGLCSYFARFELIDDAYISFRYVENLLAGHGLVFNVGERVEGYTNLLWVLLLALAGGLGFGPELASRLLGAGFALGTVLVMTMFVSREEKRPAWSSAVAPALWVTSLAPLMWAVHGLETGLFGFLLAMAFRADLRREATKAEYPGSALWYGLASLTRPEATILFAARILVSLLIESRRWRSRNTWIEVGIYLAICAPVWLGRLMYYGHPLPNTFYAKVGLTTAIALRGLVYVGRFFSSTGSLLFLFTIPAVRSAWHDPRLGYALAMLLAYLGIVTLEGGDVFPGFRFIVPILPLLHFLAQEGFFELSRLTKTQWSALGLAAGLLAGGALHAVHVGRSVKAEIRGGHHFTTDMKLVGRTLRQRVPATTRIALNPAGAVPYFSKLYAYDMLGLTDEHIAHREIPALGVGTAGHEKGDGRYILEREPEIILLGNVTVLRNDPLDLAKLRWSTSGRSEMELMQLPELKRRYVADKLRLEDGRYVAFLRRRDFKIPPSKEP